MVIAALEGGRGAAALADAGWREKRASQVLARPQFLPTRCQSMRRGGRKVHAFKNTPHFALTLAYTRTLFFPLLFPPSLSLYFFAFFFPFLSLFLSSSPLYPRRGKNGGNGYDGRDGCVFFDCSKRWSYARLLLRTRGEEEDGNIERVKLRIVGKNRIEEEITYIVPRSSEGYDRMKYCVRVTRRERRIKGDYRESR